VSKPLHQQKARYESGPIVYQMNKTILSNNRQSLRNNAFPIRELDDVNATYELVEICVNCPRFTCIQLTNKKVAHATTIHVESVNTPVAGFMRR
jgi:hypothetical protein